MAKYGHEFYIVHKGTQYYVKVYYLDYVKDFPTRFQTHLLKGLEGDIFWDDNKWKVHRSRFGAGMLTDELAQEIGDYLVALFS